MEVIWKKEPKKLFLREKCESVISRQTVGKIMLLGTPIDKENMPSKSGQNGMDSKLHKLEIVKFMCVDCIFDSMVIDSFTRESCFLFTIHSLKTGQIENPLVVW